MANEFEQFGGVASSSGETDEFSQFGGQQHAPAEQDEFAKFGGSAGEAPEGQVTQQELQQIAAKHQVNPADLTTYAQYKGLEVPGVEARPWTSAAGAVEEGAIAGVGSKVYRMLQSQGKEAALDEVNKLAEERKTLGRTAAELGIGAGSMLLTGGAGLLGEASTAAKLAHEAAVGAGYGAAAGFGRSAAGEEVEQVAKEGSLGAGLGVVGGALHLGARNAWYKLVGRRAEPVAERVALHLEEKELAQTTQKLQEEMQPRFEKLWEQASEAVANKEGRFTTEGIEKAAAGGETSLSKQESLVRDFANFISPGKSVGTLEKAEEVLTTAAVEGRPMLEKKWANYLEHQAASQVMFDTIKKAVPKGAEFMDRARLFMQDGLFSLREIDKRLGTSLEAKVAGDGTTKWHEYTVKLYDKLMSNRAPLEAASRLSESDQTSLAAALDKGGDFLRNLNEKTAPLYKDFRRMFDQGAEESRLYGVLLKSKPNYFPAKPLPIQELIPKLDERVAAVSEATGIDLKTVSRPELEKRWEELVSTPSGKELVDAVKVLSGDALAGTPVHFGEALERALDPVRTGERLESKAGSFYIRDQEIPDFIRDKNVARVYVDNYSSVARHLALREPIAHLQAALVRATDVGDKNAAAWLGNAIKDLSGVRKGTLAAWSKEKRTLFQVTQQRAANAAPAGSIRKGFHQFLASFPDALPQIFGQIYPNFLGYSVRSIVDNLAQPFVVTIPELGYKYGGSHVFGAYKTAAKMFAGGVPVTYTISDPALAILAGVKPGTQVSSKSLFTMLMHTGKEAEMGIASLQGSLRNGMNQYALYRGAAKLSEMQSKAALFAFSASEKVNRLVGSLTGVGIARDLLNLEGKGPAAQAAAQKLISTWGVGTQREIFRATEAGDKKRVIELIQNYITAKTIFNYNRLTMSEYSRFAGPMFSVFTKWPLTIGGDVVETLRNKGAIKGSAQLGAKYLAPLAALVGIQHVLMPDYQDSPAAQKAFGSRGLVGITPLGVVGDVLEGKLAAPPAVSMVRDVAIGAGTADLYKVYRAASEGVNAFLPGAGLVRFLTQDLPAYLSDTEPETGTFVGKVSKRLGGPDIDTEVHDVSNDIRERLGIDYIRTK